MVSKGDGCSDNETLTSNDDIVNDNASDISMDNESENDEFDDEIVCKDDINCKHDTDEDGKYYTCCKFVKNSDEIMDIICKCSFKCTFETESKLEDLEKSLVYYICVEGGYDQIRSVESVKLMISNRHKKLLSEMHNILYVEFMNSVQNEYYYNYYGKPDVENTSSKELSPSLSEMSPTRSYRYINARSDRTYMDVEDDIQRKISKANGKVNDIIRRAFDTVDNELMYFLSKINVKCDEKINSIITDMCRKVLLCISNTLNVDLTMECIFKYRIIDQ